MAMMRLKIIQYVFNSYCDRNLVGQCCTTNTCPEWRGQGRGRPYQIEMKYAARWAVLDDDELEDNFKQSAEKLENDYFSINYLPGIRWPSRGNRIYTSYY